MKKSLFAKIVAFLVVWISAPPLLRKRGGGKKSFKQSLRSEPFKKQKQPDGLINHQAAFGYKLEVKTALKGTIS